MRDRRRQWSLALRHFVQLDQRDAGAGPVGAADLGRVGPRRQGQNQRRVFAAVRQREGTGVAGGLRRRGGISGDDTPVIVFSDERGTGEDSQTGIGERTRDAEGREARSNRERQRVVFQRSSQYHETSVSSPRPLNSGLFGSRERERVDGSPRAGARGYPANHSRKLLGD